jgi:predicted alpha-1,2-mannosidase
LGDQAVYDRFIGRAQNYKHVFDPATKFMRGKLKDGSWHIPFDPKAVSSVGKGDFTEGNAWQYTFYVPQDLSTFIDIFGGRKAFTSKLDSLFQQATIVNKHDLDITGLIGQYAHGNEPSHHVAYLYNYVGRPSETMKRVAEIRDSFYHTGRAGLCGNEDCGQMSAWYVLSALGFYPVTPASGQYIIGTPLFEKVILHLDNGKDFTIEAKDASSKNIYIQKADLNGKSWSKSYITHSDLLNGGSLSFKMGKAPSKWATATADCPVARIDTSAK